MFHFSNKPDEFFLDLLHEALDHELRRLGRLSDDWLAEAGRFYPDVTKSQLAALKTALVDTMWYQLDEYHWFVLYEALLIFCEVFNEIPQDSRLNAQYEVGTIDFYGIVDVFFADTDCLGYPTGGLTVERRRILEEPMERWALGIGVTPPPRDKLALTVCPIEVVLAFERAPCRVYLTDTGTYPDCPEARL